MAVADLHYGYEVNRRRRGELTPAWGMEACEVELMRLIEDHRPQTLILAGDIMDGSGSFRETVEWIRRLESRVQRLVCLRGNHDRAPLRKVVAFHAWHREGEFVFHHGDRFDQVAEETGVDDLVHIVGHEHPAVRFTDGAGMRVKLPALVRETVAKRAERWVLPAFSPWAAGGEYRSSCERIATWACAPGWVFDADRVRDG